MNTLIIDEKKSLTAEDVNALEAAGYLADVQRSGYVKLYRDGEEVDGRHIHPVELKNYYAGKAEQFEQYMNHNRTIGGMYSVYFYAWDELDEFELDYPNHTEYMEPMDDKGRFHPGIYVVEKTKGRKHWVYVDEIVIGDPDTYDKLK